MVACALTLAAVILLQARTNLPAAEPPFSGTAELVLDVPDSSIEELWELGDEAFRTGDLDRALRLHGAALARDEGRSRSWNYVGGVHFARGDWLRALINFKAALRIEPRDVRACNNIGTVYERLGQFSQAEEYYRTATRIDPAYATPFRNLGVLYANRLGRPADARRAWLRYLELAPQGAGAAEVRKELEKLPD